MPPPTRQSPSQITKVKNFQIDGPPKQIILGGNDSSDQPIYGDKYLRTNLQPYFWVRSKIANFKREKKNNAIALQYPKLQLTPFPDHGFRILTGPLKINGLSRAYQYEIERLKAEGLLNPVSRNVLILGQPRQYWKILKHTFDDFANTYRIGLWVTEFEVMPPDWDFALNIVNEIWTPSDFSAKALSSKGLPVKVVPHAVRVEPGPSLSRQSFSVPDDAFLGIAIMDLGTCPDRKNPLAHIDAWKLAFGDDPNAILLMKVKFGNRAKYVRPQLLKAIGANKNIRLIEEQFDYETMTAFQRMAEVYLFLHRSEGYGLNIHEMLELGVPTIATGYSGNMTYQRLYGHAFSVDYRLAPYYDDTFHYDPRYLLWANVNLEHAAKILRKIMLENGSDKGRVLSKLDKKNV